MARHPRDHRVEPRRQHRLLLHVGEFVGQVAQQRPRLGRPEHRRERPHQDRARAEFLQFQPQAREVAGTGDQARDIAWRQIDHRGQQQRLTADRALQHLLRIASCVRRSCAAC